MSGGDQRVGLILDASLDPSGVLNGIKAMQNGFNGLRIDPKLMSGLTKEFEKVNTLITKYQSQLAKGVNTKADAKNLAKTGSEIQASLDNIVRGIQEVNSTSISLKVEDATKLKGLEDNLKNIKKQIQDTFQQKIDSSGLLGALSKFAAGTGRAKSVQNLVNKAEVALERQELEKFGNTLDEIKGKLNGYKGTTLVSIGKALGLDDLSSTDAQGSITKITNRIDELKGKATEAGKAIQDLKGQETEAAKAIDNFKPGAIERGKQVTDDLLNSAEKLPAAFSKTKDAADNAASGILSAKTQVEQLQQSTQYFFSLRNMLNLLKRGIDEAVQSVKELDKAMTDTAVVTDFSVGDMWKDLPKYTQLANELGATTKGAYETMTLYYQQGLNQQQAFALGAETMKMARIAGLDYAETTDMMTAALRGFNMELDETSAKRVNDVYSKLAAITASDTEELGTAMQRTASIAASAGASFEGTTAFLAQAIETTREPAENIGTAMKTIVARFQEMKKNPLEISEVDGEEVDYNKIDAALKTIGVDLKDTNGQFRDFDQVMLDISAKWDTLSQSQQRYIATTAAGSRQQSRFIAMVSNYDRTMQLMEAANNSAGASEEQFGKTAESLEFKLNKLHNAWELFTMGIANNTIIKGAVDGLTGFLKITNKIIDTLSLGSGALKSFLSIFAAFTGLKIAGRGANALIGGLGGLVDPKSSIKEGLKIGLVGQGKNAAQAKAITTPIVGSLSKISGQIAAIAKRQGIKGAGQKGSTAGIKETSKEDYANTKRLFSQLSGKEGFKMGDAASLFGKLDAKHQLSMFNNSPGTKAAMKKASMAWFNSKGLSKELTKEGQLYINSIYKGMKEGQIPVDKGIELIGRPDLWGEYFATDTAKAISKNFNLSDDDRKRAVDQTWSKLGMKLAAPETREAWLKENQDKYDKTHSQVIQDLFGHTQSQGKVSDLGRFANDIGSIGDKFTQAGYGITTFGNALSQLGGPIGAVGTGIAALGGAISSMGMMVSGATSLITVFSEGIQIAGTSIAISGGAIAAVVGPLAAAAAAFLLVRHHIKKVKEAGEEVTKTFNDVNKETQDNIAKLKSYQGEFASLSQGVDINGNNVSLDDSQYQRYLEIVDDIATINPAIIKGYNAQGHAILDNNVALEETLRLQEQLQKEAYKTYLSEGSLQALINARNVNTDYGKAVKNLYSTKLEDSGKAGKVSPLTNDVQSLADQLNLSGDRKAAEHILEKYGIESLDALIKGEEQAVKKFVDYQNQIQADLSNFGVDLSEGVIKGFQTLGENTKAFDEAIKPVYDNLLALVSNSSTYKDLAPEMRSALAEGLKGIASQDLGAKEMQQAANYLMLEFQDAFDKAQPYLDQADEALNTFTQDLDEAAYNDSASNIAENLRELARQAEAVGQVEIAEWYENQASRIESAITNATYSIADGVDTLADNIAKAKTNFDSLAEGIDDYYTLTDKARGLVDTALEDKNTGGNGSKTFWKTYQGLASEEAFNRHDLDEAISDMKQFQKYFAEGADGAAAFGQKLIDSQNDAFKFTKANGEETIKHVSDFFKLADDGTMQITDEFKNLSDEQYSQLAAAFKLSDDGFTAILNNLRQWGDIDFSDPELIRKALATDTRSVTTNKKVSVEGEEEKVSRLYYGESTLRAETPELTENKREDLVNDLKVQGSIELPSGAENLIKAGTNEKEDGSLLKQFVADTRGTGNQMQNVMASLIKSGEYNKEDLEKIHQSIVDQGLLAGAKDADKSFEDIYSAAELQVMDPATEAANEHLSSISSTVNTIAGIVAAGKVGEGYLPDVAKQSGNLYNELVGKKGIADTWTQKFANGKDENGYAITDKARYNEIFAKLDEYKTANDNYINELEKGRAAAEERGASTTELNAFDEEIKAAEHNAALIDSYFQGAKDSAEQVKTDFYNAGQSVFQGLADIRNNPNLTSDQQKSETADVLTGFAKQLEGLNFSPEAIAGVFKESFGIELDLKGGEFATNLSEQINEKINNLDEAQINAVLNIASIKMPGAAKGKNNTPSAIRRVGTMARGSKKHGYIINGEPTLTGELGPELVWEPKQNAAYMVGEHGPQFANLSKNAVVWNAQQTKKIKKNSKGVNSLGTGARGIHSFGTMSLANVGGGAGASGGLSIPGTFEINATANILEVIPPTPEPTIPVKADLQVDSGGGFLSKLFGGNKGGPSIDVAANITSINSTVPQTIPIIGNITQLNNQTTANNIEATATVTQVTKSKQVAGEPIKVQATATTTKVEDKSPKAKVSAGTQTMTVTANTDAAQAKINQLIRLFNKTYTLKYKASGPTSIRVPISANFTGSWKKTVEITKGSGANGINNKGFGSLASGSRHGTVGPRNRGGLTLTGEKGFEIAWLPSENRSMILGANGPQMLELPKDAVVFTNEQSKKILNQKAIPAGSHSTSAKGKNILGLLNVNGSSSSSKSKTKKSKNSGSSSSSSKSSSSSNSNPNESHFSIEEVIRFDYDKTLETLASKIKKTTDQIEKNLNKIGVTAKDVSGVIQDQMKNLEATKQFNEKLIASYQKDLDAFDKDKYMMTVSYSTGGGKNKDSKEYTFDAQWYVYQGADGQYQINENAIKKLGNKELEEAVFKAVEGVLNSLASGLLKAQDAAYEAQKQIDDLNKKLVDAFYMWKNELTEIYNLSQQISMQSAMQDRFSSQTALELARLSAGFGDTAQSIAIMTQANTRNNQSLVEQIKRQQSLIDAREREINAFATGTDEIARLMAFKNMEIGSGENQFATQTLKNEAIAEAEQKLRIVELARQYMVGGAPVKNADGTITYDIDWEKFEQDAIGMNSETAKAIKEFFDQLESANVDYNNSIKESAELLKSTYDKLKEYQNYLVDFEDTLLHQLEEQAKEEIDNAKESSESISNALKDLFDEVKRRLNERRQQEDNAKTEKDISQKQQRLAALRADTSGGHQVEIAQLQKEIADSQQSYGRTLEDQLLERLQQQGDEAAAQRTRQIELAEYQATLQEESNKEQLALWLRNPANYRKEIKELWMEAQDYDSKGLLGQAQSESTFESSFAELVQAAIESESETEENKLAKALGATTIVNSIDSIGDTISTQQTDDKNFHDEVVNAFGEIFKVFSDQKTALSKVTDLNVQSGPKKIDNAKVNKLVSGLEPDSAPDSTKTTDGFIDKKLVEKWKKGNITKKQALQAGADKDIVETVYKTPKETTPPSAPEPTPKATSTTSTNTPKGPSRISEVSRDLKYGHKGNDVKLLQQALNALKYRGSNGSSLVVDGDFGPNTLYAVKRFQSNSSGVRVDGVVGPATKKAFKKKGYKKGGLADFTGPAWLDGTPSKPELVLNATDTKNFLALRDVLSSAMKSTSTVSNSYGGDVMYDINIHVDKIEKDYDVDRVVDKVKKEITKGAGYRNVTQVRNFR